MITSAHSPTAQWTDRLLLAVLFLSVMVVAAYVAVVAVGGRVFPSPLNGLIFTALATTAICIMIRRTRDQIIRHIDRRQTTVQSAIIRQGAQLAEVTGEIPRIIEQPQQPSPRPRDEDMNGYAAGYADGLARKPIGNVRPFDQRSQGS